MGYFARDNVLFGRNYGVKLWFADLGNKLNLYSEQPLLPVVAGVTKYYVHSKGTSVFLCRSSTIYYNLNCMWRDNHWIHGRW